MSIETTVTDDGKRLIIKLDEKFDFGKVQDFQSAYLDLSEDINHIEIDLSDTEYMDSSALGMLLNMQKSLNERQCTYSITHCRPQVARILRISRFDKKFEIS